jgi:hypothetical protein
VATPSPGVSYLITVPFAIGASNGANEVFPGNPNFDGSAILIWNSTSATYATYYADSQGSASGWDDVNGPIPNAPLLPVGMGFFLSPQNPITNVFSGVVAVNVGTSNVMTLPSPGVSYLVGCPVPYQGAVTNGNPTTGAGGPNMNNGGGLADGTAILIWNPASATYATYYVDEAGSPSWFDDVNGPIATPPTISVGQGFFISPQNPNEPWTVGL